MPFTAHCFCLVGCQGGLGVLYERRDGEERRQTRGESVSLNSILQLLPSRANAKVSVLDHRANGYDPTSSPSMRSIFISTGPFTTSLKSETTIRGFSNLEVYDFVASSLGISQEMRAKNNGTLGFWEEFAK